MTTPASTIPSYARYVNMSPRLYQNLTSTRTSCTTPHPKKLPAIHPEDEEMVRDWRHRTMVEDQQKELDRWRDVKDMAAREKWAEYWAAWAAQKSLDEEKEKGKKRKYDTKEEAEAAAGDDKDRDPDYVQSEEGSSQDPLYEPSRKELKRADKEGEKIKMIVNTCIFFQHCKESFQICRLIPSFSLFQMYSINQNLHL